MNTGRSVFAISCDAMTDPPTVTRCGLGLGLVLAAAVGLAGCGGGSDSSGAEQRIDAVDGSRESDDNEQTDAVDEATIESTAATSSTNPAASSSIVSTTTTTTLPPAPLVTSELCEAIGTFYTTGQTTDFIDAQDPFALQVTMLATRTATEEVLRVGDGSPVIAPWVEVDGLLDVIDGLSAVGWDVSRADDLPNQVEVGDALVALADEIDMTAPFLIAECGLSQVEIDQLDAAAQDLAADVVEEDAPIPADPVEITDDTGRITMTVPGEWTDIVRSPQGDVSRLAAAPDFEAFDTTFGADGGFLLAVDVSDPDAWRSAFDDAVGDLVSDGCVPVEEKPYDDGVYVGVEGRFDCGAPGKTLDLFAGRDDVGSLAVLGQIVRPADDTTARDIIVGSILIS